MTFTTNGRTELGKAHAGVTHNLSLTHVTLHAADPTTTGDVGELSGGSYARKAAAFSNAAGVVELNGGVSWSGTEHPGGGTITVTHVTARSASTGAGNAVRIGRLEDGSGNAQPRDWAEGASFDLPDDQVVFTVV